MSKKYEIYEPIPDQVDALEKNPRLATTTNIDGLRRLILQGIMEGVFSGEDGGGLIKRLDKLETRTVIALPIHSREGTC